MSRTISGIDLGLQRRVQREAARYRSWWRRMNWQLLLGSLIVLFVLFIAVAGPMLAPRDPLETHDVIRVGDSWKLPPFPAFTVPGFPLGSDDNGRDLLSRLLWAVQPTMIMIAVVALVRLALGTGIGLVAGWSEGRTGRILDTLIAGALSIPILMVALGAIAAVGAEVGLPAFIVGLSVTGWAETARVVREQTRSVKGNLYIEAARALGQSDLRVLVHHVWRQIQPMVWMLFALEISSTLMVTAGLGFLGYYIGGDVWIEVADFVAGRISGQPELGQMLATSFTGIATLGGEGLPWAMVCVGTMVFIIVLGFNLLGEGLRQRLSLERMSRQTVFSEARRGLGWWFYERVVRPVSALTSRRVWRIAGTVLLVAVIAGVSLLVWRLQSAATADGPAVELTVPGGHFWPMERYDAYGTRYVQVERFRDPEVLWVFEDRSGIAGGPAVAADGTLYVVSKGGTLYAMNRDGEILWQVTLPAEGAAAAALNAAGDIYVPDKEGGLSCFTPDGDLRWRFLPKKAGIPVGGPIVAPDGTIYYPIGGRVVAVTPDGAGIWEVNAPYGYRLAPVRLSPDGELLLWVDAVLRTEDGAQVRPELPVAADQYLVGADGRLYVISEHTMSEWQMGESGAAIVRTAGWDARAIARFVSPNDSGVTRGGVIWLFYGSFDVRVVWLDTTGRVLGMSPSYAYRGTVAAVTADTLYYCGLAPRAAECFAMTPGSDDPLWRLPLDHGGLFNGGALVPGRMYATITEGYLFAIGDRE